MNIWSVALFLAFAFLALRKNFFVALAEYYYQVLTGLRNALCLYFRLAGTHPLPFPNAVKHALTDLLWSLVTAWTECRPVLGYWCSPEIWALQPCLKWGGDAQWAPRGHSRAAGVDERGGLSPAVSLRVCDKRPGSPPGPLINSELSLDPGCPRMTRQRRGHRLCISPSSSTASPPRQRRGCSWLSWRRPGRAAQPPCPTSSSSFTRMAPLMRVSAGPPANAKSRAKLCLRIFLFRKC